MARKRLIDTEELYFKADLVSLLGSRGLHLYIRLWGISEDWGGYEPKYSDIALKMGALKFSAKEVEKFITSLIEHKKIIQYEKGGRVIHWIVNFLEHQPLDNPAPPKLPLPEWVSCEILEYKSGKKYARYTVIQEKLPVGYQSTTSNGVTVTNSNRIETNSNYVAFETATLNAWNSLCEKYPSLGKIQSITESRRKKLKERFSQPTFKDFSKILTEIEAQPFLITGNPESKEHKDWRVSFDWLIQNDINHVKVLEGKYKQNNGAAKKVLPEGYVGPYNKDGTPRIATPKVG